MTPLTKLGDALVRLLLVPTALLLVASGASAQERDEWKLELLGDKKVGYEHEQVVAVTKDGRKVWRTEIEGQIAINRLGTTIKIGQTQLVVEDEAGTVLEEQFDLDMSAQRQVQRLEVHGDQATVTVTTIGAPQVRTIDWNKTFLGPEARRRAVRTKVDGGAKEVQYDDYSLQTGPTTTTVKVLGKEKVALPGQAEAELLHTQTTTSAAPGVVIEEWHDADFHALKSVTKQMGVEFVSLRSTRAECFAAIANPDEPEIFSKVSPRSNVRLPDPYHLDEVVLHVQKTRADDPMPKLEDERQTVVAKKSDQDLTLRVRKVVPTEKFTLPLANLTDDEKKCLERNSMIQGDDPEIVKLAKGAVGDEKDAWTAACKLERFAYGYIADKSMGTGFASASEVCRDRKGDCTEHGVFLAALCRAAGIPSRVAVGLLYFGGGAWGGHMWTEVSLGGKWYAIDAVLGHGGVDAAHLRLAADPLNDVEIATVFANVGLGMTMEIAVVSYRHGDHVVNVGEAAKVASVEGAKYRHLLYDLSLVAPDGYAIEPVEKLDLFDNTIVRFTKADRSPIEVEVHDVTYDFTLDRWKDALVASGVTRIKPTDRTIGGRPGRVCRGRKDGVDVLVAAVLRDEMLVTVSSPSKGPDDDAAFDAVVGSLALGH